MDLTGLYGGSFVNWEFVVSSWSKRTVSSRMMLFGARRYLKEADGTEERRDRREIIEETSLPEEVKRAFASPPDPETDPATDPRPELWGGFVDAAVAAEIEMVPYGERPPLLNELRAGLEQAAGEAGEWTPLGRWFLDRRERLPGTDLPEDPAYLPI